MRWKNDHVPMFERPEISINYEISGSGPRVLFFNGSGATLKTTALLIGALAKTCTVLAHDQRGLGETSIPAYGDKQTILDAALKQGIDAPYSCQGGICSSCLARVTEGTAEMTKNSILTEKEVADGLILTCQAHPTSATIRVDFDDV